MESVQERRVYECLVLTLFAEEPQLLDLRGNHAVVLELQHATQRILLLTPTTHPHVSVHVRLLDLRERLLHLTSHHRLHFPILPLALKSLVESVRLVTHHALEPIALLLLESQQASYTRRKGLFRLLLGKHGGFFHHLRGTHHVGLDDSLRAFGCFEGVWDGDGGGDAFGGTAGRGVVGDLLDDGAGSLVRAGRCEEEWGGEREGLSGVVRWWGCVCWL